eukprot:6183137-Pleurochrysis_carterae.AAC.1
MGTLEVVRTPQPVYQLGAEKAALCARPHARLTQSDARLTQFGARLTESGAQFTCLNRFRPPR